MKEVTMIRMNNKNESQDLRFDLYKLHDSKEDKDPRWSWIRASGKELPALVFLYIKKLTIREGTNIAAKKINNILPELSIHTILDYFWNKKMTAFPLVFLERLAEQFDDNEKVKTIFLEKIELLSISRCDSKPINAVKELNLTICKIAGAHAADGSLWGEYNYELIDADKNSVKQFALWIDMMFLVIKQQ